MADVISILPILWAVVGTVVAVIVGGTVWLIRLESKVLNIERQQERDNKRQTEILDKIDVKLDHIIEQQNKQWTRIAVTEEKIRERQ